jgi:hypothetical protein
VREPGAAFSTHDIAAWCDCDPETIRTTEVKALRKLRKTLKQERLGTSELGSDQWLEKAQPVKTAPECCNADYLRRR